MLITSRLDKRSIDIAPRALCISIYSGMTEEIAAVSEELGVPVDIFEGGIFNDGHLFAHEAQEQYDVIISQAGTAISIQPLVHVPLVTVNITALDFINAFEQAGTYEKDLVLICYQSPMLKDLSAMARVLAPEQFSILTYSNKSEFEQIVDKVLTMDHHVVMGFGGCIQTMAEANGIPYILVQSRSDSIRSAVASAKNIIEQNIREKRHARRLQNLINHSREGILSVNDQQAITICNLTAKRMLKLKGVNVMGTEITQPNSPACLRKLYGDGKFTLNSLQQVNGTSYIVSRIPVIVRSRLMETVVTFQELSQIKKMEARARAQMQIKGLVARYSFTDLFHQSEAMRTLVETARQYAGTDAAILIEGETGTGKELMAQSIHNASPRREGPFVAINCAALPEHLLESELFGYEEGAFTGARKGGKPGVFELAHNGTIFLDEIGEVPLNMQSRLLRVLQEKEVFRLGGERVISVDVRILSATNKNLYRLVQEAHFRRDLFFRLNLLPLFIPPLRDRLDDLPLLTAHFIQRLGQIYNSMPPLPTEAAMKKMRAYGWPGNVRELVNIIERLCIIYKQDAEVDALLEHLLDDHILMQSRGVAMHKDNDSEAINVQPGTMKKMEACILQTMLERVGGNQKLLADTLGISRVTVWKKLKELS